MNVCSVYLSHCSYSNELLCDAILGMNLHLSEENIARSIYIGCWLVEVNVVTVSIPISTVV